MHSTVQSNAYVVQTMRRAPHHSQAAFDPTKSLTVKGMMSPSLGVGSFWNSNMAATNDRWSTSQSRQDRQGPLVIRAEPSFIRGSDLISQSQERSHKSAPPTAMLPRTGQVKITCLKQENTTPKRAKTTLGKSRTPNSKGTFTPLVRRGKSMEPSLPIGHLTLGDLQSAIDTEYPETQGLAFNRATHYLRLTTANPLDRSSNHSTPRTAPATAKQSDNLSHNEYPTIKEEIKTIFKEEKKVMESKPPPVEVRGKAVSRQSSRTERELSVVIPSSD